MYTVSILVPIFKVEQYIERCAKSLFEQTYPQLEFIFVDDCSPDKSCDILQGLLDAYPKQKKHTRILHHDRNRGLAAARNTAIDNSTGVFVCHVDSDDYLEPDAIERLVRKQIETNADIVSGNATKHTLDGEVPFNEPSYPDKYSMLENLVAQMEHHMIWGRLIKRELYISNKIYAEEGCNVGEDWQVIVPLVYHASSIAFINYPIYHYNCLNQNSYMAQKSSLSIINEKILKQDLRSLEIVKEFVRKNDRHLYQLIKATGSRFAESSMNSCVREANRALYYHIVNWLKADKDYFDRPKTKLLIDGSYIIYWIYFNFKRGVRKLSSFFACAQ